MGEVYRATDTKLGREVAIKVIPEAFANDANRMARFAREAQVLASLNHPNIAAIYGVEERALVLELVEGPTLAERIAQGPVPLDEALAIAEQIAEAVEYAHEQRRDPSRFEACEHQGHAGRPSQGPRFWAGEADGAEPDAGDDFDADHGYRGNARLSRAGAVEGQARRTRAADIFAFGCVLYELLTGRRAFAGDTLAASLAATAMAEPKAIEGAPKELEKLVRRCLRKDPARRAQHMGDVRVALEEPEAGFTVERLFRVWQPAGGLPAGLGDRHRHDGSCFGSLAVIHFREKPAELPVVRFSVFDRRRSTRFRQSAGAPDACAGVAGREARGIQLRHRRRQGPDVDSVARRAGGPAAAGYGSGVPGLLVSRQPVRIGFSADGKLKRLDAAGGPPLTLADAPALRGGTWGSPGRDPVRCRYRTGPLTRVAAAGGATAPATKLDATHGENTHRWPWFLPDGRHFLFSAAIQRHRPHEDPHRLARFLRRARFLWRRLQRGLLPGLPAVPAQTRP